MDRWYALTNKLQKLYDQLSQAEHFKLAELFIDPGCHQNLESEGSHLPRKSSHGSTIGGAPKWWFAISIVQGVYNKNGPRPSLSSAPWHVEASNPDECGKVKRDICTVPMFAEGIQGHPPWFVNLFHYSFIIVIIMIAFSPILNTSKFVVKPSCPMLMALTCAEAQVCQSRSTWAMNAPTLFVCQLNCGWLIGPIGSCSDSCLKRHFRFQPQKHLLLHSTVCPHELIHSFDTLSKFMARFIQKATLVPLVCLKLVGTHFGHHLEGNWSCSQRGRCNLES